MYLPCRNINYRFFLFITVAERDSLYCWWLLFKFICKKLHRFAQKLPVSTINSQANCKENREEYITGEGNCPVCSIFDPMSPICGGGSKLAGTSPLVRETRSSLRTYPRLVIVKCAIRTCPCNSNTILMSAHPDTHGLSCIHNHSCRPILSPSQWFGWQASLRFCR